MIAGCPHCQGLPYVTDRTYSIICRRCKRVVRRDEFEEPDPGKVPRETVELLLPRDDRNMKIWRGKRAKLDRMVERQKNEGAAARAAARKGK